MTLGLFAPMPIHPALDQLEKLAFLDIGLGITFHGMTFGLDEYLPEGNHFRKYSTGR